VLHVGASTPLKCWEPQNWRNLAARLSSAGIQPVFLAGPGEDAILDAVARQRNDMRYPGNLDLSQVWHLLRAAQILIAPDTGIAHLGRAAGVRTVALYGPGSALISGPGQFWREIPFRAVTMPNFPCRDQRFIFYRPIDWARTCTRSVAECAAPRCMESISVDAVWRSASELLGSAISA
jgi:ADP-heptose:LPS heptosyltransferase